MQRIVIIGLIWIARSLSFLSRVSGQGRGTSLPGLLVEKYFLWVLEPIGKQLDRIVLISGTNGKTTTRAVLVSIYEDNGIDVCTNRGGANILRGICSSLLLNLDWMGKPKSKRVVLEVEEASLPILTRYIKPDILILTNVFRDQLDAYGEIDKTLSYFRTTLKQTNPQVLVNMDDHKLVNAIKDYTNQMIGFGLDIPRVQKPKFEGQEQLDFTYDDQKNNHFMAFYKARPIKPNEFVASFTDTNGLKKDIIVATQLPGIYNVYNILAALIVAWPDLGEKSLKPITNFKPVFGRGEEIILEKNKLTLMLVKNPAGFDQVLDYVYSSSQEKQINLAILINDNIADGKDVSWLWDVDLESFLKKQKLDKIWTGGKRGLDMLLRLEYAGVPVELSNYKKDLPNLVEELSQIDGETFVLSTYTALLELRKELGKTIVLAGIEEQGN